MLDILQLRVHPEELEQLHICQVRRRTDCMAAFTVKGKQQIWPVASWGEIPVEEKINVRSWFPLLDKIADEFLIWRPQGGCFFVDRDRVYYRVAETDARGVLFMELEMPRLAVVPRHMDVLRSVPLEA
ncbi:MAG TPA: hypothetical protein VGN01_03860 [Acidobacteriaceae bacterium]|jgi:hypothetical protein